MRILFAGKKERGVACLRALKARRFEIAAVVVAPGDSGGLAECAGELGLPVVEFADVNTPAAISALKGFAPDAVVLAGFSQIVSKEFLGIAGHGCLNLHAGKLPQYRGSSPLNWALINGEKEFTLSVIQVSTGVDAGDVLVDRAFPISIKDTIADLHRVANRVFPELLVEALDGLHGGSLRPRRQDPKKVRYHPLRFPEDGLILWDLFTAAQIHNRIRALTTPYPGAFTYFAGRRMMLLQSRLTRRPTLGEPGRIYAHGRRGLLICALDRCLWVTKWTIADEGPGPLPALKRYARLGTVREAAAAALQQSLLHDHQDA